MLEKGADSNLRGMTPFVSKAVKHKMIANVDEYQATLEHHSISSTGGDKK